MHTPGTWAVLRAFRSPPASDEDEAAFAAYTTDRVVLYGCAAGVVLNVLHLLWWPTDRFLLPPGEDVHAAVRFFRASTFVNHAAVIGLLTRPALRRWAVLVLSLGAAVSCVLLGATMARLGRLDQPYFHMTYLVPMAFITIPLRLPQRVAVTAGVGAAVTAAYLAARPEELASPFLGSAMGCMAFAVVASAWPGHLLFVVTRRGFLGERALARSADALKGYSEHMEDRVAEHAERIRLLAAHLERASEEERARLSRELHDELGQELTGMRYALSSVRARLHKDPQAAEAQLAELDHSLGKLATEVRDLVSDLRPRVLDDRGLGAAVEWLAQRTQSSAGVRCELSLSIDDASRVSRELATATFRIIQESLTNAVRHARAGRVLVVLEVDRARIRARVEDDGCGMAPVHAGSGGMGLLGMSERARNHGGRLDIESRPGAGTSVSVDLPLGAGEAA